MSPQEPGECIATTHLTQQSNQWPSQLESCPGPGPRSRQGPGPGRGPGQGRGPRPASAPVRFLRHLAPSTARCQSAPATALSPTSLRPSGVSPTGLHCTGLGPGLGYSTWPRRLRQSQADIPEGNDPDLGQQRGGGRPLLQHPSRIQVLSLGKKRRLSRGTKGNAIHN